MDPQPPNVPEVPAAPEMPQAPKDNHGITIAAMAVFVLLSLAAVAFLYYQNQQLKTMLASYQTQTTPTPTATTDPTANWKTYTSAKYGYSLKYPSNIIVRTGDWVESNQQYGLQPEDEAILRFVEPNQPPHGGFPYGTTISLKKPLDNTKQLSTIEWVKTDKNFANIKYSVQPVDIAGIPSLKVTYIFESRVTAFLVPFNGKMYEILAADFLPGQSALKGQNFQLSFDYDNLYDQILSTFKFIGPTSSPLASPVACTQEAKLCPDGTSVGRTGPNCEFAPCPTP